MTKKKRKRNLITTLDHIERYHRRRSTFILHATLSLVFQAAMWINWYTSYAVQGNGFDDYFFTPRIGISVALMIFLAAHFALLRVMDSKDRMVIEALRQHQEELDADDDYGALIYDDNDEDDEDNETPDVESANRAAKLSQP